ncbi:MAG TPA: hypothetical protein VF240_09510 [Pyrinomonadaceae bacterium]
MIHHISIPAENPRRVAEVLAEIWGGRCLAFPPFPGSYIVIVDDGRGSAIEVTPLGMELAPGVGDEQAQALANDNASPFTATHVALSVPAREERIKEVAAREGWRAVTCDRGGAFEVVEFWIENRLLVEMLPPAMQRRYLASMTSSNYAELFGIELDTPAAQELVAA